MVATTPGGRNIARPDEHNRVEHRALVRNRLQRAGKALGGGLAVAALVSLSNVHDVASLFAVLHHMVRDWYEIPVLLAVVCPLLYALERRPEVSRTDDEPPPPS